MCRVYGSCFTRLKLVDSDTVVFYQTAKENIFAQVDAKRAKSEVALVDMETGQTTYGINAFLKILFKERPLLRRFFNWSPAQFLVKKLYRFISFNRHVITGPATLKASRSCTPDMHKGYRWLYLLLAALFTGFMVNHFAFLLDQSLGLVHNPWREYAICFGQISWQFLVLTLVRPATRLDYLGNMSTVSIIGGFLLVPLLILSTFFDLNFWILMMWFGGVVTIMLGLHIGRCKRLGLPIFVTASWVIFRMIVLILILITIG